MAPGLPSCSSYFMLGLEGETPTDKQTPKLKTVFGG